MRRTVLQPAVSGALIQLRQLQHAGRQADVLAVQRSSWSAL
jgi:hypothetical protein